MWSVRSFSRWIGGPTVIATAGMDANGATAGGDMATTAITLASRSTSGAATATTMAIATTIGITAVKV
jgi:hypothetical protein